MFEDSLLIIKSDYMHKRKPILLKLLQKDFQIQGRRRLRFTPELAAEFYKNDDGKKNFMLLVIMLSKGNAEAFILARENCVEELMTTMVCYFGTSVEMERNLHVSATAEDARREIPFIFPNYIYEPIPTFMRAKFSNNPLSSELLTEAYDIVSSPTAKSQSWKVTLAEWLERSNATLPIISNVCAKKPFLHRQEQVTLATQLPDKATEPCVPQIEGAATPSTPSLVLSSAGSSMMMTSSSCITCSCFDGEDTCYKHVEKCPDKQESFQLFVKHKVEKLSSASEEHVCEEVEWIEEAAEEEARATEEEGERVEEGEAAEIAAGDGEKLEGEGDVEVEEEDERKSAIIEDDEPPPPSEPVEEVKKEPAEEAPAREVEELPPAEEPPEQKDPPATEDAPPEAEQALPPPPVEEAPESAPKEEAAAPEAEALVVKEEAAPPPEAATAEEQPPPQE